MRDSHAEGGKLLRAQSTARAALVNRDLKAWANPSEKKGKALLPSASPRITGRRRKRRSGPAFHRHRVGLDSLKTNPVLVVECGTGTCEWVPTSDTFSQYT